MIKLFNLRATGASSHQLFTTGVAAFYSWSSSVSAPLVTFGNGFFPLCVPIEHPLALDCFNTGQKLNKEKLGPTAK